MKKMFFFLIMLVSMQAISLSTEAQALDVNDEIVNCIDIDVGTAVLVNEIQSKTQNFNSYSGEDLNLINEDALIVFNRIWQEVIYNKNICNYNHMYRQITNKDFTFKISKTINGSSGGIPA